MVRQPRMPCYKLAAKFQRDDMIERFLWSARSGVYFSVSCKRRLLRRPFRKTGVNISYPD
jgi:hypothetical protein